MNDRITLQDGASPKEREIETANWLISHDKKLTIRFLKESKIEGQRSPDAELNHDKKWEIKNPEQDGEYTLYHAVRHGLTQSDYLIIDLRHCKIYEDKAVAYLTKNFKLTKSWKSLWIITKSQKLLTFEK
ncbi:MAG: hypothetical protein LBM12_02265 [Candidatus Nomurabacteria bacterium]|jgi:hypothetical protein|nr:hypothetical protein [Candidatus Nomurabacteria bacterium]